jgi:DNA-binding NarL/FixJ family response regulator
MIHKIMIVEDHPVMRDTCSLVINRSQTLEVCAAVATAEEALQQVLHLEPDLILVDISLPGMSGIELTAHLNNSAPELPVLIMTGHGDARYQQDALSAGADGFIFKHDGPKALLNALHELLQ